MLPAPTVTPVTASRMTTTRPLKSSSTVLATAKLPSAAAVMSPPKPTFSALPKTLLLLETTPLTPLVPLPQVTAPTPAALPLFPDELLFGWFQYGLPTT